MNQPIRNFTKHPSGLFLRATFGQHTPGNPWVKLPRQCPQENINFKFSVCQTSLNPAKKWCSIASTSAHTTQTNAPASGTYVHGKKQFCKRKQKHPPQKKNRHLTPALSLYIFFYFLAVIGFQRALNS